MHDARVGRHDREVVERALAPAQERVALLVALELALGVDAEGVARAEGVDLHGVVDHELGRDERVDLRRRRRPSAAIASRIAARSTTAGTPVKSCISTRAGREGDLLARLRLGVPAGERLDVGGVDRAVALGAQQVLEQDLQREGQPRDVEALLQGVEAEDLIAAAAGLERVLGAKAVLRHRTSRGVVALAAGMPAVSQSRARESGARGSRRERSRGARRRLRRAARRRA